MNSVFEDLYRIFDEYGATDLRRYKNRNSRKKREIATLIAEFYTNNLRSIITLVNRSQGLIFNFDDFNPKFHSYQKVARKAVFYSEASVILLEKKSVYPVSRNSYYDDSRGTVKKSKIIIANSGEHYQKNSSKPYANEDIMKTHQSFEKDIEFLLSLRNLVLKNIIIPLPDYVHLNNSSYTRDQMLASDYVATINRIKNCDLESTIVPVSLDKWQSQSQIMEYEKHYKGRSRSNPMTIYLPHLRNLSLDSLVGVREDNFDEFMRFQGAMKNFLISSSNVKSENAFIELARKVDFEVKELQNRVQAIRKERNRKGLETFLGMSASAISFMVDPEISKMISAVVASKSVFDGYSLIQNGRLNEHFIQDHNYYLAYKTNQINMI